MKVALYTNKISEEQVPYIKQLLEALKTNNIGVLLCRFFHEATSPFIVYEKDIEIVDDDKISEQCIDIFLCIGGDGTLLNSIQHIKDNNIPVMGINTGRLGFLANTAKENINESIRLIKEGKYTLDKRQLLKLETDNHLFGDLNFALNELTIHKNVSSSMITIHTYVDNVYLNSYWADGLIISTPTGSTAYSLSCGGPIVLADTETFIITPIAPHNLNVRPVVISNKKKITLKVDGRSHNYLVSLDSRSTPIEPDAVLTISLADFTVNLVRLEGQGFYNTIRNKLLWGLDKRN